MIKHFRFIFLAVIVLISLLSAGMVSANHLAEPGEDYVCLAYFTGIGCPHCAKVEPFAEDLLKQYPDLVIIKYEIYQNQQNAPILMEYAENYGVRAGIPLFIFNNNTSISGDTPIIRNAKGYIEQMDANPCPLADGSFASFNELECDSLPGKPEILMGENKTSSVGEQCEQREEELTFAKILGLAAVDAVNPCAIAVLALMLIAIMSYNPKKRLNVLWAGLAFVLSVFIMYLVYGLVIIKFFQLVKLLTGVRLILYKILGVVAIILGLLNIRDFVKYRPGRLGTEMPLMLRPKVKKVLSKVTSPKGAFVVGLFVTLFLLPCTIGPYVIAGGILSALELLKTLPWLALYNLVFVLPMIIITVIVYLGFATVENVSGWKDRNIKWLHLIAGIIMALLGIAMLIGWV